MFSGLVQGVGRVRWRRPSGPGSRLRIDCGFEALELGESIAVNGACLTAVAIDRDGFEADVSRETAERTNLGRIAEGGRVNLERSLKLGDRLGGHLVSGHVDALAEVGGVREVGDAWQVNVTAPAATLPFLAPKGSVTLDGVSLTVNAVHPSGFEVMLIPHTRQVTTLGDLRVGSLLNLEVDLLARYVVRYLEAQHPAEAGLRAALRRSGFVDPEP